MVALPNLWGHVFIPAKRVCPLCSVYRSFRVILVLIKPWISRVRWSISTRCSQQVIFCFRTVMLFMVWSCLSFDSVIRTRSSAAADELVLSCFNMCFKMGVFPFTEASLSGVEPLMQKIHGEIRRVDASILSAVRQQVRSASSLLLPYRSLQLPFFFNS